MRQTNFLGSAFINEGDKETVKEILLYDEITNHNAKYCGDEQIDGYILRAKITEDNE